VASIDSVIDTIRTAIPTYSGFSTKAEILNPYSLEDNPDSFLTDSWGLLIGSGTRSAKDELLINYEATTIRNVSVILCRAVYDVRGVGKQVNEQSKTLLADCAIVRDNFLGSNRFGLLKSGEEITYVGDSGINFLGGNEAKFIYTQIDFTFEIIEQLT